MFSQLRAAGEERREVCGDGSLSISHAWQINKVIQSYRATTEQKFEQIALQHPGQAWLWKCHQSWHFTPWISPFEATLTNLDISSFQYFDGKNVNCCDWARPGNNYPSLARAWWRRYLVSCSVWAPLSPHSSLLSSPADTKLIVLKGRQTVQTIFIFQNWSK